MMSDPEQTATLTPLVKYDITEAEIATLRDEYSGLTCDTPKGYDAVRVAIGRMRTIRTFIEQRRVTLKADALAFGRLVDSEAKRFTRLAEEIEEPLKAKKALVDDERERVRREAEAEKRRRIEAEIAANRARQEADAKAIRDAEEQRLAEERARLEVERAALADERRKADEVARAQREAVEAAQAVERARLATIEAAQRAEREAIEAERRKVAAEREKTERAEFERQAKIKAEADAKARAEREADAAKRKAEAEALAAAERQARLDAMKPDLEKARTLAAAIRALSIPAARTKAGKEIFAQAVIGLGSVAAALEEAAAQKVA